MDICSLFCLPPPSYAYDGTHVFVGLGTSEQCIIEREGTLRWGRGRSYLSYRNRMSGVFAVSYTSVWASFIWWFPCSRVAGCHVSTHWGPAQPLLSASWRRARWCLLPLYCSHSVYNRRHRSTQPCCGHSRPSQDCAGRWCLRTHRVLDHIPSWDWNRSEL